jgi:hypothetical protein
MRRGDAQQRRAARLTTTADHPWSARAEPARVWREAPSPHPRESEAFARPSAYAQASSSVRARPSS